MGSTESFMLSLQMTNVMQISHLTDEVRGIHEELVRKRIIEEIKSITKEWVYNNKNRIEILRGQLPTRPMPVYVETWFRAGTFKTGQVDTIMFDNFDEKEYVTNVKEMTESLMYDAWNRLTEAERIVVVRCCNHIINEDFLSKALYVSQSREEALDIDNRIKEYTRPQSKQVDPTKSVGNSTNLILGITLTAIGVFIYSLSGSNQIQSDFIRLFLTLLYIGAGGWGLFLTIKSLPHLLNRDGPTLSFDLTVERQKIPKLVKQASLDDKNLWDQIKEKFSTIEHSELKAIQDEGIAAYQLVFKDTEFDSTNQINNNVI